MDGPLENGGAPVVKYTLPEAIKDDGDRVDLQWILNYGQQYGAVVMGPFSNAAAADSGPPMHWSIRIDAMDPHVYDTVMSFGRQCVVKIDTLVQRIRRRVGKHVLTMTVVLNSAVHRIELHVRTRSHAAAVATAADKSDGRRGRSGKRMRDEVTTKVALPDAVKDERDQEDIQWILEHGRRHGATEFISTPGGDTGPAFSSDIRIDAVNPHVYDIVASFGRQCIIKIEALLENIRSVAVDSLLGDERAMTLVQQSVVHRIELHVRYLSRAALPKALPDDTVEERPPPAKRLRTDM